MPSIFVCNFVRQLFGTRQSKYRIYIDFNAHRYMLLAINLIQIYIYIYISMAIRIVNMIWFDQPLHLIVSSYLYMYDTTKTKKKNS